VTTALFADDSGVISHDTNYNTAVARLKSAVNNISIWAKDWKIRLNEAKSVRIDFSLRPHPYVPTVMEGKSVPLANSVRYLDLFI
jgi:hypothetical protein